MAKKIILGFGIAVVFAAVVHYGFYAFIPRPNWENYQIKNYWERYNGASLGEKVILEREKNEKNKLFNEDWRRWATKYFYIGLPIGILAVVIASLIKLPAVGSGLLAGGILVLIESYGHYWGQMPDISKFLSLSAVFIILVWVGYRKIERSS